MTQPTERKDGLHCVYGACRGMPCHPGCSFTVKAVDPYEAMLRQIGKDASK